MDNIHTISLGEARFLALHSQKLLENPVEKTRRKVNKTLPPSARGQGLLDIIEQLGIYKLILFPLLYARISIFYGQGFRLQRRTAEHTHRQR
jgi:hypothetical protein